MMLLTWRVFIGRRGRFVVGRFVEDDDVGAGARMYRRPRG